MFAAARTTKPTTSTRGNAMCGSRSTGMRTTLLLAASLAAGCADRSLPYATPLGGVGLPDLPSPVDAGAVTDLAQPGLPIDLTAPSDLSLPPDVMPPPADSATPPDLARP